MRVLAPETLAVDYSYASKNIDCLTVPTACLVCFISTVNGCSNIKRKEKKNLTLGRPALVAGT